MTSSFAADVEAVALPLPGASLRYRPDWLPEAEADALFAAATTTIPWERHRLCLFGREIDAPRMPDGFSLPMRHVEHAASPP